MGCLTEEQLDDLAAGALGEATVAQLMAHVDACATCSGRLGDCRADQVLAREIHEALSDSHGSLKDLSLANLPSVADDYLTSQHDELTTWESIPPEDSIPGYDIIREIHRGGQGVVYEAIQQSTQRTVAVKVLLEGPFSGERARWRFEREVKLVARLRHPNIVVIHDSGIAHSRYYFAMEYVRGQPLDTHIRLAELPTKEIVRLFAKVCDAVSYAHRRGVIHRDLKPSNILVGENGQPQVLDFGLAKIVGEEMQVARGGLVTQTGQLMGTLRYMAPEQTLGDPEAIDTRTDVYTLGVILYELLTRKAPYGTDGDLAEALTNIRESDPPRPSRIRREVNRELEAIVLKAMHKEADRRYQSAHELQQDLEAWLEGRPVTARSDSALYVLRKLAARHYFHTSVIVALVASIFGFAGITYHALMREQEASDGLRKINAAFQASDRNVRDQVQLTRANSYQGAMGWFLMAWHAEQRDAARRIHNLMPPESPEYKVAEFLLNGGAKVEQLNAINPPLPESLVLLAMGEWYLKAGRLEQARDAFTRYMETSSDRGVERPLVEARLAQLAEKTKPGDGSTRPAGE